MDELSVDELSLVPDELRPKVDQLIQQCSRAREIESDWQKHQAVAEQEHFEIEQKLEETQRNLQSASKSNTELRLRADQLESERNERVRQMHEAQQQKDNALCQKADLDRSLQSVGAAKEALEEIIKRKDGDIGRLKEESQNLNEKMKQLVFETCQSQISVDEIKQRELSLEYREKRWQQDKELAEQEKVWLGEELARREQQLNTLRQEMNMKVVENETALAEKVDKLSEARFAADDLKHKNQQLTTQVEDLNDKIKQLSDEFMQTRQNYERELQSQTNLCNVYKESSSESESKIVELTKTIDDMRAMYEEAKQSHFQIQEEMSLLKQQHSDEVTKLTGKEAELSDELEKANELLRSKHRVMLTDEEVAALSPGAAAASRLIKSGLSLTGIYRDHLKVVEELEQQKIENRRLEQYFTELVKDIETKAPLIKEQRDEYYRLLDQNTNFRSQLADVDVKQKEIISEKDSLARQFTYTKAELERYQRDCSDLSAQVRQLMQCLEKTRRGDANTSSDILPPVDDLYLFRNIDELQSTNQRLMSALREAEAKREEMVQAAQQAEMSKVRNELESALKELESFKDYRQKQNKVIEAVCEQRDTYKRLLQEKDTKNDAPMPDAEPSAGKAAEQEAVVEKLNLQFETYRKEKNEVQKVLEAKIEQLQSTVAELRSTNSKLSTDMDYQQQRFKILQSNSETYKREVDSVKERLAKASATLAKNEERMSQLNKELMSQADQKAKLEVESRTLKDQLDLSRSSEHRLRMDVERAEKGSRSNEQLIYTLQQLHTRVDRVEAEKNVEVQQNVDGLTKERNRLQQTITELTEQQHQYVRDSVEKMNAMKTKLEEEQAQKNSLEEKFKWTEERLNEQNERVAELKKEIDDATSSGKDASAERYQKEARQLKSRLDYLEVQYQETKRKNEDLTEKLRVAEEQVNNYQQITATMETSFNEQKSSNVAEGDKLRAEMEIVQRQSEALTEQVQMFRSECDRMRNTITSMETTVAEKEHQTTERIQTLETELKEAKEQVILWQNKEQQMRADKEQQSTIAQNLERRLTESNAQLQVIEKQFEATKLQLDQFESELSGAQSRVECLNRELEQHKESRDRTETDLNQQLSVCQEREKEMQTKTDALYDEIQKLGNQVACMERATSQPSEELSAEGDRGNMSGTLEVVGYLREEKRQACVRAETAETETRQLKSRVAALEEQLTHEKLELEKAQMEAANVATALKEKSQLSLRLQSLEKTNENNKILTESKAQLESELRQLKLKLSEKDTQLGNYVTDKESLQRRVEQTSQEMEILKKELAEWQQRHHDLMEQRAQFDPEQVNALRKEIDSLVTSRKLENEQSQAVRNELTALKTTHENLTEECNNAKSQLSDLQVSYEDLSQSKTQLSKILQQARQLARNYKQKSETLEASAKELTAKIEQLEKDNNELKESKPEAKGRTDSPSSGTVVATDRPGQIRLLNSKINTMAANQKRFSDMLQQANEKLKTVNKEKANMQEQMVQLQNEKKILTEATEEQKFRMQSLTSLHDQCDAKFTELQEKVHTLEEEKNSLERQLSTKTTVQPVTGIQSLTTERAASSSQEPPSSKIRPIFRATGATVASVRPISSRPIRAAPSAPLSPGPSAQPDQSSSSTTTTQASVAPVQVVSTTQPRTAFVAPHQNEPVISSSSAAVRESTVELVEPPSAEATAAPAVEQGRKRPGEPESSVSGVKRLRTSPSEQVTTSDQTMEQENILEAAESSLRDYEDDEEDDDERQSQSDGDDEPEDDADDFEPDDDVIEEQVEPDEIDEEDEIQVTEVIQNNRERETYPPRQIAMAHMGYGDQGDDGIVPSTPTISLSRPQVDTSSSHVPQHNVPFQFVIEQQMNVPVDASSDLAVTRSVPHSPSHDIVNVESDSNGPSSTVAASVPAPEEILIAPDAQYEIEDISADTDDNTLVEQDAGEDFDLESGGAEEGGQEESSEAVSLEQEDRAPSAGEEDNVEPSTSQQKQRKIQIRKPVVWDMADQGEGGDASQQPSSSSGSSGRQQTARRGGKAGLRWARKRD